MWIHEANKIKVQEPRLSIGDTSLPLFMLEKTDVRPQSCLSRVTIAH